MHGTPRGQLGDGRGRPDRRHRRPLRRPRDRRDRRVRPAARRSSTSTSTPAEIGKIVDGRHPDRRRRASSRWRRSPARYEKLDADERRLDGWWTRIRGWQADAPERGPEPEDGCADPEATLDALVRRARRRDRDHRRRPAPDVGGQPPAVRRAAASGSPAAGSARWASACRPRSAPPAAAPGHAGRLRVRRGLVPDERAGARDRGRGAAAGQGPAARQRLPGHGPPAAGHVLGRPPHRRRPRREPRLGAAGPRVRRGPSARSATPTTSPDALAETLAEDGPSMLHVRIAPEANCLPMFRPGGPAREMIG